MKSINLIPNAAGTIYDKIVILGTYTTLNYYRFYIYIYIYIFK